MLKIPTLFVVGAGASAEFDLPVGTKLASQISQSLDIRFGDFGQKMEGGGDHQIYSILQQVVQEDGTRDVNPYLHACWLVRDGIQLSYSIDNFLDKHAHEPKVQLCGRLAIVKRILEAERHSKLYVDRRNTYNTINFQGLATTWIVALFKMMQDKVRRQDVGSFFDDARFITFNYDRCIEHFFFHALQRNYGMDAAEAAEIMKRLQIIHPYGRVGRLPWEARSSEPEVDFGAVERAPLADLSQGIRTYADDRDDRELLVRIQQWVRESGQAVFLGFSYQEQNLDLLGEDQIEGSGRVMLGSAFGISEYNRNAIEQDLVQRFPRTMVKLADEKAADLLEAHSKMFA